jgi:glutamate/aspartate transport system substrate-binding protein
MRHTLTTSASLLALALAAGAVHAQQDTLDKMQSTHSINVGAREASGVMSFTTGNSKYTGFHIEVCEKALAQIKDDLKLPKLDIQYHMVTAQNRIPLVKNGTVDLVCGTTTNNEVRQQDVAFAPTLYVEEVRMAVHTQSGVKELQDLAGKTVAATTGTTSVTLLRKFYREKNLDVTVLMAKDNAECILLLDTGRATACVADGQILAAGISRLRSPDDYQIVGKPLSVEPIAIMLNKQSPKFQQAFNETIRAMATSGEVAKIYDKWFMQPVAPATRAINLPASEATKAAWAHPNDKPVEAYLVQ